MYSTTISKSRVGSYKIGLCKKEQELKFSVPNGRQIKLSGGVKYPGELWLFRSKKKLFETKPGSKMVK